MTYDHDATMTEIVEDYSDGAIMFSKTLRVFLTFAYAVLLGLAIYNIWHYLYLQKMWKSYPMIVSYILLVLFSTISFIYELYMVLGCGERDCVYHMLTDTSPQYVGHFNDMHKTEVTTISVFWKLR